MDPRQVSGVAALEQRIQLETFIADCGARLAEPIPYNTIEDHAERALGKVCGIVAADRCLLIGATRETPLAWITCGGHAPGIDPLPPSTNFAALFPWHVETARREQRAVGFRRVAELPAHASRDRDSARAMGVRAMLMLAFPGKVVGARLLVLQCLRDERDWPEYYADRLGVLGRMLMASLDRKRAEETAQQVERSAEDWLAAVHAILWRANPGTGETTFISREVESMLGYPVESWIKVPGFWLERVHAEDREWVRSFTAMALREARKYDFEYRMITAEGRTLWLRNIVNVRVENDVPIELVGVTVDVSNRKRGEFETAKLRHDLAHALRVTSIGELAATLAHELNQPLGAIVSNAESAQVFLKRSPPALEDLEATLTDIAQDSQRAAAVLHRVRNLLQKEPSELQPLDVASLVSNAVGSVRALAHSQRVDLSVDLGPDLPAPYGDAVQVQQVLLNLVANAMDAVADRPEGKRHVNVRAVRTAAGVGLSVSDTGPGIPSEMRSRVFEPFFSTKKGGMGMGLTICRTIVHGHRGNIRVGDNPGGGAVVSFTLPVDGDEVP